MMTKRQFSSAGSAAIAARTAPRQRSVDEYDPVGGVGDRAGDLLREEPDIDGVQHRAHARDGEVQLEVAVRVPAEARDAVARPDAEPVQGVRQLRRALRRTRRS